MGGFTQTMRDCTDGLLRDRDRVGLELVHALANRANEYLITDIGIKRLGEECGRGRKTIEKKLVEFILCGWVRVHSCADDEIAAPRVRKMLAPNIVMPVSPKYEAKVMHLWNTVFQDDISIVTKDHQRYYRLDIDSQTKNQTENQTENQRKSHTINSVRESEGIDEPPVSARHYAQRRDADEPDNPVGTENSFAEHNTVGSNAVGTTVFGSENMALSKVQSVSDFRMHIKAIAPDLTPKEIDRYIARSADLVMLAIEAVKEAGDSVKPENRTRYFVGIMQRLTAAQTKRAYVNSSDVPW